MNHTSSSGSSQAENLRSSEQDPRHAPATHSGAADPMKLSDDLWDYFQAYARAKPEVVAMWSFGIGFVLGWKLKPW